MIETAAIEHFFALVKRASQARSKDFRMDMADAVVLATEISTLLLIIARENDQQKNASSAGIGGSVTMDGGGLRDK